jgi:hypothetical protein
VKIDVAVFLLSFRKRRTAVHPTNLNLKLQNCVKKSKKCRGKSVPLQAWTGPEGSRRLRLQDFKTLGT